MERPDFEWEPPEFSPTTQRKRTRRGRLPIESRGPSRTNEGAPGGCEPGDLDLAALYLRDVDRHRGIVRRVGRRCRRSLEEGGERGTGPGKPGICDVGRGRLVARNLGLVVSIAKRYQHLGLPLDDLIQEGNIGLLTAARRFEPQPHRRFSAYAAGWIRQTICRALTQKSRTIRIPLRRLALRRHAATVEADVEQRCGNEACATGKRRRHVEEDDARELGVTPDQLRDTIRLTPDMESLDAPAAAGCKSLLDSLPNPRSPNPMDLAAESEQQGRLREAVSHVPSRLGYILVRRYGLAGDAAASLAEIGLELHLTPERVRQLQKRALELLRHDLHREQPAR